MYNVCQSHDVPMSSIFSTRSQLVYPCSGWRQQRSCNVSTWYCMIA